MTEWRREDIFLDEGGNPVIASGALREIIRDLHVRNEEVLLTMGKKVSLAPDRPRCKSGFKKKRKKVHKKRKKIVKKPLRRKKRSKR